MKYYLFTITELGFFVRGPFDSPAWRSANFINLIVSGEIDDDQEPVYLDLDEETGIIEAETPEVPGYFENGMIIYKFEDEEDE